LSPPATKVASRQLFRALAGNGFGVAEHPEAGVRAAVANRSEDGDEPVLQLLEAGLQSGGVRLLAVRPLLPGQLELHPIALVRHLEETEIVAPDRQRRDLRL
jgi:hypothetical protein